MKEKCVVLLSAGLDSSYNFYRAFKEMDILLALTFNYGQRAAAQEVSHARALAKKKGVSHQVVELPWFSEFTSTSLIPSNAEVPTGSEVDIHSLETSQKTAKLVWVPNRNGIFLNIAAGFAEGLGAQWVIPGFNKEEATTFPDNSVEYIQALDQSFAFSTASQVRVKCFSQSMDKSDIMEDGKKWGLPFKELWPCYFAGETWCGSCESCKRFFSAAEKAGVSL